MKTSNSRRNEDSTPNNGVVKEHYKDGTLANAGKCWNGEKVEWRIYGAAGKLIKTTKHNSKQEKS